MYQATIKMTAKNDWDKEAKVSMHRLEAATEPELFKQMFKDFFKRYTYCNHIRLEVVEPEVSKAYGAWISDINNYAEAGGDMW